jgi:succinoglycan biosynthesis protein ExoM
MNKQKIIVGIPTFRRPKGLLALLQSLAKQTRLPDHILIADNEGPNGQGFGVVEAIKSTYSIPLTIVPVVERGISAVRNALLDNAFGVLAADALVMIDDDQSVDAKCIDEVVTMWNSTGASLVGCAVVPVFDVGQPNWAIDLPLYYTKSRYNGICPLIYGTGGVLIARSNLALSEKFNAEFGLTGSGDEEFFMRLHRKGAISAFAQNAIVYEHVPEARTNIKWVLNRAFRVGAGHMRVLRLHPPTLKELCVELAKLGYSFFITPLLLLLYAWHPMQRVRAMYFFVNAFGKLYGLTGKAPKAYLKTDGS